MAQPNIIINGSILLDFSRFFDESRREHTVDYDGNMPDTFKWVFDIFPEDIGVPVENGSEKF